ncbi:hypothetical protein LCGC14_1204440 [marine sediment metagenome]|uniref:Uncharacterized protein n=1 Tax=marine sediment metagenome TaxID=412755 RepID=A0A0F9M3C9_9ZZZZ
MNQDKPRENTQLISEEVFIDSMIIDTEAALKKYRNFIKKLMTQKQLLQSIKKKINK